jgi:hypothetical protein
MQLYQERVIKKIKDEQSNLENNQDDDFSRQIIDIEN